MRFVILFTFLSAVAYAQGNASDGYVVNEAAGKTYKLMYNSKVWSEAKTTCVSEGARLAVPKTQDEFDFIQKIVRGMQYHNVTGTEYKLLAWVGINNLENYKIWRNLDGENIEDSDFHTFSGSNGVGYSDDPAEPHCVGLDAANPGLRDWWCHRAQPFICEKSQ